MYHQITRNKRNSIIVVTLFLLVWLAAGFVIGELSGGTGYAIEDPSPNAFATGRDPQHAAVTVTTGLLQIMNREELEGVLAHEMSHIKNFDVRLLLVVTTMIGLAAIIASVFWNGALRFRSR